MHSLMERSKPIPTLYIKSFESPPFPQFHIRRAFVKARTLAPCLMLFEDVDSLVGEKVRSFFLNEVDGLENNTGILMIATTNHGILSCCDLRCHLMMVAVENLDPALAKRPTRFDRKYAFRPRARMLGLMDHVALPLPCDMKHNYNDSS
jgi:transitional endoplasmic reticulum ATPase